MPLPEVLIYVKNATIGGINPNLTYHIYHPKSSICPLSSVVCRLSSDPMPHALCSMLFRSALKGQSDLIANI